MHNYVCIKSFGVPQLDIRQPLTSGTSPKHQDFNDALVTNNSSSSNFVPPPVPPRSRVKSMVKKYVS